MRAADFASDLMDAQMVFGGLTARTPVTTLRIEAGYGVCTNARAAPSAPGGGRRVVRFFRAGDSRLTEPESGSRPASVSFF